MFATKRFIVLFSFAGTACAAAPGTHPNDMSATQHQAAAKQEETAADTHASQHDPSAVKEETRCGGKVCWTSRSNPTAQHSEESGKHRELATKHRAAAAALQQAEANACAGIDEEDRDISPFYHREDIASVSASEETVRAGKGSIKRQNGARIVFRAVPGLTAEWLQREVDCHLARAAAVGYEMPEMSYCPLALKGVNAKVSSTGDGFAVDVTSQDKQTVTEVVRRAQALQPAAAPPHTASTP